MKKMTCLLLSLLLCLSLFAGCSGKAGDKGELVLYTWEGMFPQEVLDGFEEETGISINYANFDYDETMLAKLEAASGGEYDLVLADDYIIETVIQEGLAQKLDKEKLSNWGSINPLYQGQFFDPQDEYTVPHGAGVQTIVYDPEIVGGEIKGYGDLWDPALAGNVGLIANYRVINGMALKVLGKSYNVEDTGDIQAAGQKLLELAPNVRLIKDDNLQDDLISGEVGAAVMYTSQATLALTTRSDLKVAFPEEGIGFGIMASFIPANAPHPEAAYQFMDYILQPDISAQCFEFLGYYCTNKDAEEKLSEETRPYLTLPDSFSKDNMEMIENISAEAMEEHQKVWTEFKAACE
ncbi:spermidine/putrescine ABC transporter substrate-binding protein [Neglecta sp. X4]|uniref:polyamine ABC transporter substrate-binding protein n=1 Tax=unclassified Neglectibacter TaxID=2632164 RepID=UPI00136D7748|nr:MULTISPECIES: spermidine/putrescine ABC transporter substrate-binding protein [unclassified Neglectibacter]NBI18291.1 spermidine/putrescine ABC transporter substrate-binding protein [Neglectibacter sp. 59]NBJ73418.1 spermidine/putrescine ABC transporter substrate-binding protein [Neglectibacter sp. X4]NCE81297.1 spermidine/putrescine ABC transporter substrate-binding protein [Neglectibacter sp. X58]